MSKATEKQRGNRGRPTEKSLANLTPWQPGQSGNPAGRPPKAKSITDTIRAMIEQEIDGTDIAKELAKKGIDLARSGDFKFWKEIIERLDGKVPDHVTGDGTLRITINHVQEPLPGEAEDDDGNND